VTAAKVRRGSLTAQAFAPGTLHQSTTLVTEPIRTTTVASSVPPGQGCPSDGCGTIPAGFSVTGYAACPAGTSVVGGGYDIPPGILSEETASVSAPFPDSAAGSNGGWTATFTNTQAAMAFPIGTVYAVCAY
jgi:hypothetical protein